MQRDRCAAGSLRQWETYLAQNWDWWSIGAGTTVILEVDERPYPKALIVTEAGLVGGKGLNAAGVGVSLNAMSVKKGQIGVPLHVILRNAVQQPTVPKAIDTIAKAKRAGSACVGLASADGLVVAVEYAPSDLDILLSDGHPLCHTNHWALPLYALAGRGDPLFIHIDFYASRPRPAPYPRGRRPSEEKDTVPDPLGSRPGIRTVSAAMTTCRCPNTTAIRHSGPWCSILTNGHSG